MKKMGKYLNSLSKKIYSYKQQISTSKRYPTSLVTRERQINEIPLQTYQNGSKSKKLTIPSAGENTQNWNPHTLLVGMQNASGALETIWQFLIKSNIHLSCDPVISLLGIYSNEIKAYINRKTYTCIFIVDLFVISKTGNKCPSTGKWTNKLAPPHNRNYSTK